MTTKSEQYIYNYLEKEYNNTPIHLNSLQELYDDLKEQIQRNIKKSISLDKIKTIVTKYTKKSDDGTLLFKLINTKKKSAIKLNINNSTNEQKNIIIDNINNENTIKPVNTSLKKINNDMFEEVNSDENTIETVNVSLKKINNDMFEEVNSDENTIETVNVSLKKINNDMFEEVNSDENIYKLIDKPYNIIQIKDSYPYTTDFFLNKQEDDIFDDIIIKRRNQLRYLKSIISPEQKSPEWYILRRERITASDGGTIIGWNKYNAPYECLFKKIEEPPFCGNENVFHGNKYEDIAALLYQDRMNVKLSNFGLLPHPTCHFLGASPDVIIDEYKLDGIHKTNLVGRMIEIKCPSRRKIITSGDIFDQCPKYYWVQVQLQLECCDLDECDFIQCELDEYPSWESFIDDTIVNEPYKSETFGLEKGCVIQILPKSVKKQINYKTYDQIVYDNAKHIYPPTIYMSPFQYQQWIEQVKKDIEIKPEYQDKYFDKVCYWRLEKMGCCLIKRDREWYSKYYQEYEQFWNNVLFFRQNNNKFELLKNYFNLHDKPKYGWSQATNDNIQNVIKILTDTKHPDYLKKIKKIEKDIELGNIQKIEEDNKKQIINKKVYVKNNTYVKKKISVNQFELLDD
jgi:putative phage-type endonuclease